MTRYRPPPLVWLATAHVLQQELAEEKAARIAAERAGADAQRRDGVSVGTVANIQ